MTRIDEKVTWFCLIKEEAGENLTLEAVTEAMFYGIKESGSEKLRRKRGGGGEHEECGAWDNKCANIGIINILYLFFIEGIEIWENMVEGVMGFALFVGL